MAAFSYKFNKNDDISNVKKDTPNISTTLLNSFGLTQDKNKNMVAFCEAAIDLFQCNHIYLWRKEKHNTEYKLLYSTSTVQVTHFPPIDCQNEMEKADKLFHEYNYSVSDINGSSKNNKDSFLSIIPGAADIYIILDNELEFVDNDLISHNITTINRFAYYLSSLIKINELEESIQNKQIKSNIISESGNQRYNELLSNSGLGLAIVKKKIIVKTNHIFQDIIGYSKSELENSTFSNIIQVDDYKWVSKEMDYILNQKLSTSKFSIRLIHKNGKLILLTMAATVVYNYKNNYSEIILTFSDESSLKEQETILARNEAIIKAGLKNSSDCLIALDDQLNLILLNRKGKKRLKKLYARDLVVGDNLRRILPTYDTSYPIKKMYKRALNSERIEFIEWDDSGEKVRYFQVRYIPIIESNNQVLGFLEVSRDMTNEKSNEENLRTSLANLKAVINNVPENIVFMDDKPSVVLYNENAKRHFKKHYDIDVVPGLTFDKLEKTEDVKHLELLTKSALNGERIQYTFQPDQSYYKVVVMPVSTNDNRTIGTLSISYDMSLEKNNEAVLIENEKRYRRLVEELPSGIIIIDANGMTKYVSNTVLQILELENDSNLLGKNLSSYIHKQDREKNAKYYRDVFNKRTNSSIRIRVTNDNNKEIIVEIKSVLSNSLDSEQQEFITSIFDVSDRIDMENEKMEIQAICEALIKNSFVGIDIIEIQLDKDTNSLKGSLIMRNDKMTSYLESKENLFLDPESITDMQTEINQTKIADNKIGKLIGNVHKTLKLKTSDGDIDVSVANQLLRINNKTLLIRNYKDITDQKYQESIINNQLVELNQKANELKHYIDSNLQLENFAYIASHDLKAPVRSIISFGNLFKELSYEKLDAKSKHFCDIIMENANDMHHLIDDLLLFSKVNKQTISVSKIKAEELFHRVITKNINNENVNIDTEINCEYVYGDLSKLQQLLQNLIQNSIKFSANKNNIKIQLSCSELDRSFLISVHDEGIGIEKEYFDKIFIMFQTLHANSVYKGNGMGLAICKKIAEQHNGRIWVESEFNVYTKIFFTISKELIITEPEIHAN